VRTQLNILRDEALPGDVNTMKTVLIVEDDLINARVFSKILTRRGGFAVKHTENVEEVMEIAQARGADIILMDVSLSRSMYKGKSVDGIKITQMLKEDPQTADLPIILVTAHAMEGDRENFLAKSGADGYISKPVIDHQVFVDQVRELLKED
jgi:two-component system, cell cycle response regulator DivK